MEKQTNAVGRRKEAVTRVFVSKGSGKITVNDKDYKHYFPLVYLQNQVENSISNSPDSASYQNILLYVYDLIGINGFISCSQGAKKAIPALGDFMPVITVFGLIILSN